MLCYMRCLQASRSALPALYGAGIHFLTMAHSPAASSAAPRRCVRFLLGAALVLLSVCLLARVSMRASAAGPSGLSGFVYPAPLVAPSLRVLGRLSVGQCAAAVAAAGGGELPLLDMADTVYKLSTAVAALTDTVQQLRQSNDTLTAELQRLRAEQSDMYAAFSELRANVSQLQQGAQLDVSGFVSGLMATLGLSGSGTILGNGAGWLGAAAVALGLDAATGAAATPPSGFMGTISADTSAMIEWINGASSALGLDPSSGAIVDADRSETFSGSVPVW